MNDVESIFCMTDAIFDKLLDETFPAIIDASKRHNATDILKAFDEAIRLFDALRNFEYSLGQLMGAYKYGCELDLGSSHLMKAKSYLSTKKGLKSLSVRIEVFMKAYDAYREEYWDWREKDPYVDEDEDEQEFSE